MLRTTKKIIPLVALTLIGVILPACADPNVMNTRELTALIEENLSPGDSAEDIEAFLEAQGWPYSYDRFAQRYQTGYPEGDVDNLFTKKVVAIWIYVDESKSFSRVEVENIYTGM